MKTKINSRPIYMKIALKPGPHCAIKTIAKTIARDN